MITSSCDDRPTSLFSALLLCKLLVAGMKRGRNISKNQTFGGKVWIGEGEKEEEKKKRRGRCWWDFERGGGGDGMTL